MLLELAQDSLQILYYLYCFLLLLQKLYCLSVFHCQTDSLSLSMLKIFVERKDMAGLAFV